jgi:hypothetical protein
VFIEPPAERADAQDFQSVAGPPHQRRACSAGVVGNAGAGTPGPACRHKPGSGYGGRRRLPERVGKRLLWRRRRLKGEIRQYPMPAFSMPARTGPPLGPTAGSPRLGPSSAGRPSLDVGEEAIDPGRSRRHRGASVSTRNALMVSSADVHYGNARGARHRPAAGKPGKDVRDSHSGRAAQSGGRPVPCGQCQICVGRLLPERQS